MRPGHEAPENLPSAQDMLIEQAGFNEAGARGPGKLELGREHLERAGVLQ